MSKIKVALGFAVVTLVLFPTLYFINLELFVIPSLLYDKWGQLGVTVHVVSILFLIIVSGVTGSWLSGAAIFKVQEKLVDKHLSGVTSAITNLTTGRWASDSYTHKEAFKTGASLGYKVGAASEPQASPFVLEGISRMALPAPVEAQGQDVHVIEEMAGLLDDMDGRRGRLSG
jgi:hypothetical protein